MTTATPNDPRPMLARDVQPGMVLSRKHYTIWGQIVSLDGSFSYLHGPFRGQTYWTFNIAWAGSEFTGESCYSFESEEEVWIENDAC